MHILPAIFIASSAISPGGKLRMLGQCLRRRLCVRSAAANRRHRAVGLNHIALAAEQKRLLLVANEQQRFQVTQEFVGAPVLGQLHRASPQIAVILLELGLKAAEQSKRVGRRSGKSGDNLVVIKPPDLSWPNA